MGATLPKTVEAAVVERHGTNKFKVAVAEMNGYRNSMEDAHLIFMRESWAMFGVFDGHGGEACSKFVAKRFREELETDGCPKDDAVVKKLFLQLDQEFLDSEQTSGSTATCVIVQKPDKDGGKHLLHVINAGDSRVILGRRDGTIVDGFGTEQGLTTDHKPDHPDERERIYRCGGTVEHSEGNVPRVNGNLAVSRAFGDREEKKTGGPGLEDHPVTANPEMGRFECDQDDFLLLVCDGVSEGNFPNPEVVKFVASGLAKRQDLGEVARGVCHKAIECNSKDNITCMIVLLSGADVEEESIDFVPGPITNLGHKGFQKAYETMAAKAGWTLAQAAESRYLMIKAQQATSPTAALTEELAKIGEPSGDEGSDERRKWFEKWIQELPEEKDSGPGGMDLESFMGKGGGKGGKGSGPGGYSKGDKGDTGGGKGGKGDTAEEEVERKEDGYTWSQKGEEVQILFKLNKPASKKDIKVSFKLAALSVGVQGETLLDGSLGGKVDVDDCTWCVASGGSELQVMLTKKDASDNWKNLLK